MPAPVHVPADIDREDRILGELTVRQVLILAGAAVVAVAVWAVTGLAHLIVAAVGIAPIAILAVILSFGRRDGLALSSVLWAALVQRVQTPTLPGPRPPAPAEPEHVPGPGAGVRRGGRGRSVVSRVPVRGIHTVASQPGAAGLGVVDLAGQGLALVCAVTPTNLALRSEPEQAAALAAMRRWLHALTGPVQIVTRTRPLQLGPVVAEVDAHAAHLAHPALAAAARAHADHLAALDDEIELTTHEILLVFRDPTPARPSTPARRRAAPARRGRPAHPDGPNGGALEARAARVAVESLIRRAEEAAALLGPAGLRVGMLNPACAARALRAATYPGGPDPARPGPASHLGPWRPPGPPPGLRPAPPPSPVTAHRGHRPVPPRGAVQNWQNAPTLELPVPAPPPHPTPAWSAPWSAPWPDPGGDRYDRPPDDTEVDQDHSQHHSQDHSTDSADGTGGTGGTGAAAGDGGHGGGWPPQGGRSRIREALDGPDPDGAR